MQGTRVRALVWEDLTCHGATKSMRHNYWACALESESHNYWAHVLQLLKPVLCNKRSHRNEEATHHNEEYPPLAATREKPACSNKDPTRPKISKKKMTISRSSETSRPASLALVFPGTSLPELQHPGHPAAWCMAANKAGKPAIRLSSSGCSHRHGWDQCREADSLSLHCAHQPRRKEQRPVLIWGGTKIFIFRHPLKLQNQGYFNQYMCISFTVHDLQSWDQDWDGRTYES